MIRTSGHRNARKAKKSYTLSPESVEFLEAIRKRRHAPSVSSVLEEILQAARREQGQAALERAVSDYYASLPRDAAEEQTKWGDFALREFPSEGA
jgi:DNA-binding PadR family transcriptional regulator